MGHSQPSQSSLGWFLGPGQLPLQSLWPHILTPGPQDGGGGQCKGKGGPTQPGPMSPGATQQSGPQPASPSPPPHHHPSPPPGLRDWPGKNPREPPRGGQRSHPALRPKARGARPSAWTPRISLCKKPNKHKTTQLRHQNLERGVDTRRQGAASVPEGRPLQGCRCRHVLLCSLGRGLLKHLMYVTSN